MESPEVTVAKYAANISQYALWVSVVSAVFSGGVLALELRRWFDEGVRLTLSLMTDMQTFGSLGEDDNTYIVLNVTNRGTSPTTITHMFAYHYPSWVAEKAPKFVSKRIKKWHRKIIIINPQLNEMVGKIPYVLEPGRNWVGMAKYTPGLVRMINSNRLFVGIHASHQDKPYLVRARGRKVLSETENP